MSRPLIERTRIFVGCEGESERSYAVCLAKIARDRDLPVAVDAHIMREGDPLSRIAWAVVRIAREEEKRGPYPARFVLLDRDQAEREPDREGRAIAVAKANDITIIWQQPDHEGLLLLHFEHNEKRQSRTKAESMRALLRVWAGYEKNSTARQYGRKIDQEALVRASNHDANLGEFLMTIGLIERPKTGERITNMAPPAARRRLDL